MQCCLVLIIYFCMYSYSAGTDPRVQSLYRIKLQRSNQCPNFRQNTFLSVATGTLPLAGFKFDGVAPPPPYILEILTISFQSKL